MVVNLKNSTVSKIMLLLLLSGLVVFAFEFNVKPAKAWTGTVYIRADGSIDPPDAPIATYDHVVYTLTDNITSDGDGIVVERDNIIVNGAGYMVQGTDAYPYIGIKLAERSNVTIENLNIKGFYYGVSLYNSSENRIVNSNIMNNFYGISLESSSNNVVSDNDIRANSWIGISVGWSAKSNVISSNYVADNNLYGIFLYNSTMLLDNTVTNNTYGVLLRGSKNTLRNNNIYGNRYNFGVTIYGWWMEGRPEDFINDVDVSNTVDGKPIYYWINKHNQTVPTDAGYVALVNCTNIRIQNLNIRNGLQGLLLAFTKNSTISQNRIAECGALIHWLEWFTGGVELVNSSGNFIYSNTVVNSTISLFKSFNNNIHANNFLMSGIHLFLSSSNVISRNTLQEASLTQFWWQDWLGGILLEESHNNTVSENHVANGHDGILLYDSANNTIRNNSLTGNRYNFGVYAGDLMCFINDVDVSNTVDGKPIYYWINKHNQTVPTDAGYVALVNCTNIRIQNLLLINNKQGVLLAYTSNSTLNRNVINCNHIGVYLQRASNSTLSRNIISCNHIGVYFGSYPEGSSNNILSENSVTSNYNGVFIYSGENNIIYHNDFIDNVYEALSYAWGEENFWDAGYPSGGNYWSAYEGTDRYSGPYQNETGSDGIGDTPYIINSENVDHYPLMTPWLLGKFLAGELVWTTTDLNVREGPGLSYSVVDTMLKGNIGTVLSGPVEADGYNWWYINYSVGVTGWSTEDWLQLAPIGPSAPQNFAYWTEAATNWAEQHLGSGKWSGLCLRFVANAFMQKEDKPAGWPSALDAAREFYRFNQEPCGWQYAPKGALIFFDREGTNDYGHVGIYLGNGSIIHAYGTVRVDTVEETIAKPDVGRYLGWSYPPESWRPSQFTFKAVWDSTEYPVTVSSNSIVTDFEFNQPLMQISFKISGELGMQGYCNITIPKTLLEGEPWTVQLNGTDWTFTATSNQTHSFIYFTYTHASSYQVTIQGTSVIPEIPTHLLLLASMSLTIIPLVLIRKRTRKTES